MAGESSTDFVDQSAINIDQLGAVELPPPEPLKSIQKKPEAWDITQLFYSLKRKRKKFTGKLATQITRTNIATQDLELRNYFIYLAVMCVSSLMLLVILLRSGDLL